MEEKEFYTANELAEYLSMHPDTIYRYIKRGKIKAVKIGEAAQAEWRIPKAEVERITEFKDKNNA